MHKLHKDGSAVSGRGEEVAGRVLIFLMRGNPQLGTSRSVSEAGCHLWWLLFLGKDDGDLAGLVVGDNHVGNAITIQIPNGDVREAGRKGE